MTGSWISFSLSGLETGPQPALLRILVPKRAVSLVLFSLFPYEPCLPTTRSSSIWATSWQGCLQKRGELSANMCEQQLYPQHRQEQGDDIGHKEREEITSAIFIWDLAVERVSNFKYSGIHISDDLTWTLNTTQVLECSAVAALLEKEIWHVTKVLNFYRCIIKSIQTSCITVWDC